MLFWSTVPRKGQGHEPPLSLRRHIFITLPDRRMVTMDHP